MTLTEYAPAKINLCLHVTGKRDDGYHLLQSLVTFGVARDILTLTPAPHYNLSITGQMAQGIPLDNENIVTRAAMVACRAVNKPMDFSLALEKNIPSGAGLGGGSADAAAALRLLQTYWGIQIPDLQTLSLSLGADVPMCLNSTPAIIQGVGEDITPINHFPALPMILIWPNVHCETKKIFTHFSPSPYPSPRWGEGNSNLIEFLSTCTNDLEAPARALFPVIGTCLDELKNCVGIRLARMTGSGSACFGIADNLNAAHAAATHIKQKYPDWWVDTGVTGS